MIDDIVVEVAGVIYTFKPLQEPLKEMMTDRLIIVHVNKRSKVITNVWMCNSDIDYNTQGHMESILVSKATKWFTKDYAMTRVGHIDVMSVTFTGPDKKSLSMSVMGDTLYAIKPH